MKHLRWMAQEKDELDWDKWSTLLAMTINCHVSKKDQISPSDINPYTIRKKSKQNFAAALAAVHAAMKQREQNGK